MLSAKSRIQLCPSKLATGRGPLRRMLISLAKPTMWLLNHCLNMV